MKKYILLFILGITGLSCSDDFLELNPISDAASGNFYKTVSDIEVALNGVYSEYQNSNYYGGLWTNVLESRSDNIDDRNPGSGAGVNFNLNKFQETSSNPRLQSTWESMYRVVGRANTVLNRMEGVEINATRKNELQAEAKFLRALTYFNLVRLWGEVPLIVDEVTPETVRAEAKRNTVAEVYTQIRDDFNFAIDNLAVAGNSGRANVDAANVLLAKVLMTQGLFSEAIPYLRRVSTTSLIPLSEVWDVSNELNDEMIFVIKFKADSPGDSHGSWFNTTEVELVSDNLFETYDTAGDTSRKLLVEENNDLGGVKIPLKYQEAPFGGASYGFDYPVVRRADVVLLLAECLNEVGYTANGEAFNLLNKVRTRAGIATLTDTDLSDQSAFRDAVFDERRLEFALEGKRWFDIQRSGKATEILAAVGVTFQSFRLLYPVPQTEIEAFSDESRFWQNPGH